MHSSLRDHSRNVKVVHADGVQQRAEPCTEESLEMGPKGQKGAEDRYSKEMLEKYIQADVGGGCQVK